MIIFDKVSKVYYNKLSTFRKSALIKLFSRENSSNVGLAEGEYYVLRNLSLQINKDDKVLLLSPSTLELQTVSKIICGITKPSGGQALVKGSARLVNTKVSGHIPFVKLKTLLHTLILSQSHKNVNVKKLADKIIEDCNATTFKNEVLFNIPDDILSKMTYYTSIMIDSDIYILPPPFQSQDTEFMDICEERLKYIFSNKTVVYTRNNTNGIPVDLTNAFLLVNGTLLMKGPSDSVIELFNTLPKPESTDRMTTDDLDDDYDDGIDDESEGGILKTENNIYNKASVSPISVNHHGYSIIDYSQLTKSINIPSLQTALSKSIMTLSLRIFKHKGKFKILGPCLDNNPMFELFIWIPFLRWALDTHSDSDRTKACAITSEASKDIYSCLGIKCINISELIDSDALRLYRNELSPGMPGLSYKSMNDTLLHFLHIKHFTNIHPFRYSQIVPAFIYPLFNMITTNVLPVESIFAIAKYSRLKLPRKFHARSSEPSPDIQIAVQPCVYDDENHNKTKQFFKNLLGHISEKKKKIMIICNCGKCLDIYREQIQRDDTLFIRSYIKSDLEYKLLENLSLFIGTESYYSYLAPHYGVKTFILIKSESDYSLLDSLLNCSELSFLRGNMILIKNPPQNEGAILNRITKYIPDLPASITTAVNKVEPTTPNETQEKDSLASSRAQNKPPTVIKSFVKTQIDVHDMNRALEHSPFQHTVIAHMENLIMNCNKKDKNILFCPIKDNIPEFELLVWIPFMKWFKKTLIDIRGNFYCVPSCYSLSSWYNKTTLPILNIPPGVNYNKNNTNVFIDHLLAHYSIKNCLIIDPDILIKFIKLIHNQTLLNEFLSSHSEYDALTCCKLIDVTHPTRYILIDIEANRFFTENERDITYINKLIDHIPTNIDIIDISNAWTISSYRNIITKSDLINTLNVDTSVELFETLLSNASLYLSTLSSNSWSVPLYGKKSINCISTDEIDKNKIYKYARQSDKLEFYSKKLSVHHIENTSMSSIIDEIIESISSD